MSQVHLHLLAGCDGLWRERAAALAGVVLFDDVPIARRSLVGRQAEHG